MVLVAKTRPLADKEPKTPRFSFALDPDFGFVVIVNRDHHAAPATPQDGGASDNRFSIVLNVLCLNTVPPGRAMKAE
jgi:hypothetical protein